MNYKTILSILLILSCCSKRPSDTITTDKTDSTKGIGNSNETAKVQTDSLTTFQQNYEKSMIHREYDNDSLLLDVPEVKRLIKTFIAKSKKVKEKEYGAGDYFGKYRVYADKLDTLVIDKGDGGDYGFGSTIYFMKKDSLVLYRNYEFSSQVSEAGQFEEVTEQLVTFKNGFVIFKQRQMRIKDWSKLNFGDMKFETIYEEPIKYHQKEFKEKLKHLYELELVE